MKTEMKQQIEEYTPHTEKVISGAKPLSPAQQEFEERKNQAKIDTSKEQFSQIQKFSAGGKEAQDFFEFNLVGKVPGADLIKIKNNELQIGSMKNGKAIPFQKFNLKNPTDVI